MHIFTFNDTLLLSNLDASLNEWPMTEIIHHGKQLSFRKCISTILISKICIVKGFLAKLYWNFIKQQLPLSDDDKDPAIMFSLHLSLVGGLDIFF